MEGQRVEVQVVSPGASVEVVTGEPERVVRSLPGEAGDCGCCPDVAVGERDTAADR